MVVAVHCGRGGASWGYTSSSSTSGYQAPSLGRRCANLPEWRIFAVSGRVDETERGEDYVSPVSHPALVPSSTNESLSFQLEWTLETGHPSVLQIFRHPLITGLNGPRAQTPGDRSAKRFFDPSSDTRTVRNVLHETFIMIYRDLHLND